MGEKIYPPGYINLPPSPLHGQQIDQRRVTRVEEGKSKDLPLIEDP